MAGRTIRQVLRINVQLLDQLFAARPHVDRVSVEKRRASVRRSRDVLRWRNSSLMRYAPRQKNLVRGTKLRGRIAVAIKTPSHRQRFALCHQWHVTHITVTRRATDAFCDVNAVIEENVVGERVHSIPMQRLLALCAQNHWPQHFRVSENLRMTRHAGLRRWHSRECRSLDGHMAVAAVDPQFTGMMPMTEENGLIARDADRIPVGRPIVFKCRIRDTHHAQCRTQDEDAKYRRRTRTKKRYVRNVARLR
jgi:hypothetical protein